jgi:hypothetical protein
MELTAVSEPPAGRPQGNLCSPHRPRPEGRRNRLRRAVPERDRARWAKANAYTAGLAEAMARPHCGHRSCLGISRCVYA